MICSGTGSVERALRSLGYEVYSCDLDAKWGADFVCDASELLSRLRAEGWKPGDFEVIWASPPCTEYSISKTVGARDLKSADRTARACVRCIEWLNPKAWYLENPASGLLKARKFMQPLQSFLHVCSYCRYGTPYRKNTAIWTNQPVELKSCNNGSQCRYKKTFGRHRVAAQSGPSSSGTPGVGNTESLYPIPPKLLAALFHPIAGKHWAASFTVGRSL